MVNNDLTVVHVIVGEEPAIRVVENTVEGLRDLVEGSLEVVPIVDNILMVANEYGYIDDLPINFTVAKIANNEYVELQQDIHGNVFFVGMNDTDFCSLSDYQIEQVKDMFSRGREVMLLNI